MYVCICALKYPWKLEVDATRNSYLLCLRKWPLKHYLEIKCLFHLQALHHLIIITYSLWVLHDRCALLLRIAVSFEQISDSVFSWVFTETMFGKGGLTQTAQPRFRIKQQVCMCPHLRNRSWEKLTEYVRRSKGTEIRGITYV